jgi:hypothetical protein
MKSLVYLMIFGFFILSCHSQKTRMPMPNNMKQIMQVMPYVQNKIKTEYRFKKFKLYVYNSDNIRAMIYDEDFIFNCSTVSCDSVCKVLAIKIKDYSKEKSENFIGGYNEIVITLARRGDHIIKGSTIDTDYKYKITDL